VRVDPDTFSDASVVSVAHNRCYPPALDRATVLLDAGSRRFQQNELIEEALSSVEAKRLAELERDIEAGQQAFIKTGTALAEIRDARLYRPRFKTFEYYCQKKWGFHRDYAYKLIEAAAVSREMSTVEYILPSERVARELAKLPRDQRKEIFKSALAKTTSEGRTLTAKDISDAFHLPTNAVAAISNGHQVPTTNGDMPRTVPVKRIAVSSIATRPDLMQFKQMDNSVTGENDAEKLTGQWDDLKAGNLLLWEPLNPAAHQLAPGMKYIVANGHHRFAFGQLRGVKSYNAQIIRESDGLSPQDAARLAAEINIADGKGNIYDHVKFIRNLIEKNGKEQALEAAQRYGSPGRAAQDIVFNASATLYDSFINEQISPETTRAIANAAPVNEAAQRIGIKIARNGMAPENAANFVKAFMVETKGFNSGQMVLFGSNAAAMELLDEISKRATQYQHAIREQISAVSGAVKKPVVAAKLGVNVHDPKAAAKKLMQLRENLEESVHWQLNPVLVAKFNGEIENQLAGKVPVAG